ncbi:MAG TPA: flagellar basal body L-ring protein FlgH [Armatimonadota bacterium]|jgi:flagellar L-ring protein precursor FlgH
MKNPTHLIIALLLLCVASAGAQQPAAPSAGFFAGLFVTPLAHQVGDLVTVIISESTTASHTAGNGHDHSDATTVGPGQGWLAGIPLFGWNGQSSGSAKTTASRQETLNTRVAARIVAITPTGNYLLEGQRQIQVNRDQQSFTLRGEVRPLDLTSDNTVASQDLVNAQITYSGSDPSQPTRSAGFLTRVLNWLF